MWSEDIKGSEAYAKALQKTGILTDKETKEICEGLEKVRAEWAAGEFKVVVSRFGFRQSRVLSFLRPLVLGGSRCFGYGRCCLSFWVGPPSIPARICSCKSSCDSRSCSVLLAWRSSPSRPRF